MRIFGRLRTSKKNRSQDTDDSSSEASFSTLNRSGSPSASVTQLTVRSVLSLAESSMPEQSAASRPSTPTTTKTPAEPRSFKMSTASTPTRRISQQTQSPGVMSTKLAQSSRFNSFNGAGGAASPPQSPRVTFRSHARMPSYASSRAVSGIFGAGKTFTKRATGSNANKIGLVRESAISLQRRSMAELGAGVYQDVSDVSYIGFLEWIRSERLTTLPHKGSRWDKVLIRALYFAEQLNNFDQAIQGFALDSSAAASIGYGHARLLLELGQENSEALDKAFSVFYKFGMSFSSVLRRSELLAATPEIREQLCLLYTDLLSFVVEVAIKFYKTVNGMVSGRVSLDIFQLFGDTIETFRTRQNSVIELVWDSQIEKESFEEGEALGVKILSRWLAPEDRVLTSLNRDYSTFVDQQVEFTCIWFQKHLSKFIQSNNTFLLVTGQPGAGKTTLAGSIVERLQRPVNRQQFDTLFCSLSPDIPTTATSLAVVKSLLSQLLVLRVGNMGMYYAIFQAYNQCRTSDDLKTYEEHLWQALADTLQNPVEGDNEVIMVVDGLDEIAESQSASIQASGSISPATLLEKLARITSQGRRVRLITLSSSIKMPSQTKGSHHQIKGDDIRDDIHAVALKALIQNPHFRGQPTYEQETVLDRIIQTSSGSFLWTILACEVLNSQKSLDALAKTLASLEKLKPSVQDLVLQVFNSLNTTENARTLLSWVLAAERPLTIDEIHTLFTIDVQRGTFTDTGIDVNKILGTLKPLLTTHERIVRFKHPLIHSALHNFANNKKIPIPLKDSETDLLLRVLMYAKLTIREKGEPTLNISDPDIADRLFHQHHFLEYTVRYWVLHLQQSPLCPKPGVDYKPTVDLLKVMPETTILPILEQLCWSTQLPVPYAVDLHRLVLTVRGTIFGGNHPSVLQTNLSIASSYMLLSKNTDAQTYFYYATKISRTVLSDIHPLTLECAGHFLKITETMTTTSRTDIMTHREEFLILLITAYERQYGSTSEMVVQTRKLLFELYVSINEEDRAMEIFRLIQEATVQQYGRNSHQARDIQGQLGVTLGKVRVDDGIESYAENIFDNEDEEDTIEVMSIATVVALLRAAELLTSRKEFSLAEQQYVELWTEVSSKCRTTQSIEWHEKNIEIATAYSQLLNSQKRTTESSAILACIWQQYEHHQLSFTESIILRLTSVAKELKSMGSYTQALSIFKFASSYYKNARQEESQTSREINNQVSETSTELVKQSLASSSTITETTSTVSESVFHDVFFSVIKSSKTVDTQTIALAKKLTVQYMAKKNFSAAINVIQATLQRTWSSFNASSIHSVTMTSTFTKESIELVERLAECYMHTKQLEKVEDTYSRFFRAVLVTKDVDKDVFELAKGLLINFYDKHSYPDKAISVFQEVLVTSKAERGHANEYTIQTLYTLAKRCQRHPRNHPYWIDYYLQIITSLNKDSDVCHKNALDAIIIVASTYWEDRRYAEAVTIYRVLWNTFIGTTKEHKQFSEVTFVQRLYEQYYQCLEETKANWDTLYQVTKEYRETSISLFGAESTIALEATLALAQVTQRSENHVSQAISLYEEASKSSKITTTKTSVSEMKQALSSLYIRQMKSQSASSYKEENVERAISITEEQLTEAKSKYGYSHEVTLTHLRELVVLQHRQKKTDIAIKQLTTAVSEIISKETSSQKMMESAASIAMSFQVIEQTSTAHSLVQELHRQICAKEARYASKWSFDLTKTNRSALAFIASLEYSLRKDISVTFAEIIADLTLEYIYFEYFGRTLQNKESLTKVLLAAAPLRWFLRRNDQKEMIIVVEDQTYDLFIKRDARDLNTLSQESPRIFITGILDHLGNGKNKNFIRSVILASNASVTKFTNMEKFPEAYDIAFLGFMYASKNDGYNGTGAIGMGFKLASLLVGRDGVKCPDPVLRKKMLDLSNRIVKHILDICKKLKINFAQVQLYELSQLSLLLGEQEDYETLEWLLTTLWNTRDAQRTWPAEVLLNLGRRLICVRYLAGYPVKAIRLCEDIAYNMRRAHGPRAPVTIETYELLAQLYTSAGQSYQARAATEKTGPLAQDYFKKAIGVHQDILRMMLLDDGSGDDSDEELDTAAYLLAKEGVNALNNDDNHTDAFNENSIDRSGTARYHFYLLKLAYQRFGGWPKSYAEYEQLNAQLFRAFGNDSNWKSVQGTDKWDAKSFGSGKAESQEGGFSGVQDWAFGSDKVILHAQKYPQNGESSGRSNGSASFYQQNGNSSTTVNGKSHVQNGGSNGLTVSKMRTVQY